MKDVRVSLMTLGINVGSKDASFLGNFPGLSDRFMRSVGDFRVVI
jgi:hypothetical protein